MRVVQASVRRQAQALAARNRVPQELLPPLDSGRRVAKAPRRDRSLPRRLVQSDNLAAKRRNTVFGNSRHFLLQPANRRVAPGAAEARVRGEARGKGFVLRHRPANSLHGGARRVRNVRRLERKSHNCDESPRKVPIVLVVANSFVVAVNSQLVDQNLEANDESLVNDKLLVGRESLQFVRAQRDVQLRDFNQVRSV